MKIATASQQSWFDDEHREATVAFEREHNFCPRRGGHAAELQQRPAAGLEIRQSQARDRAPRDRAPRGRNAETWNVKGQSDASDRFNYDYPDNELSGLANKIRALSTMVELIQAVFNNNYGNQAQRNGKSLQRMRDRGATSH
jgi:uncharacterized protein YecE (DUF72 family)